VAFSHTSLPFFDLSASPLVLRPLENLFRRCVVVVLLQTSIPIVLFWTIVLLQHVAMAFGRCLPPFAPTAGSNALGPAGSLAAFTDLIGRLIIKSICVFPSPVAVAIARGRCFNPNTVFDTIFPSIHCSAFQVLLLIVEIVTLRIEFATAR